MAELGKLARVNRIRDIWPDEARNFTPWLAEEGNLSLLSEALGFGPEGFEFEAMEVNNGAFRADILCRDTTTPEGERVLIENQFGKSDHDHLGKLITYASGLKASTLVLIGEEIRDEHRSALDWLNEISTEQTRFFAVSMELWRIGDSLPAPRFNVIVKPNDWTRGVVRSTGVLLDELTPHRKFLLRYWTAFEQLVAERQTAIRPVSALPQNWIVHSIGKTGVTLNTSVNSRDGWIRTEVYLTGARAKTYFFTLKREQEAIEAKLGESPVWQDSAAKDCRIHVTRPVADISDETDWPAQHAWMLDQLEQLYGAFHDRVRRLDADIAGIL